MQFVLHRPGAAYCVGDDLRYAAEPQATVLAKPLELIAGMIAYLRPHTGRLIMDKYLGGPDMDSVKRY